MTDARLAEIRKQRGYVWYSKGIEAGHVTELLDAVDRLQKFVPQVTVIRHGSTYTVEHIARPPVLSRPYMPFHSISISIETERVLYEGDIASLRAQGYRVMVLEAPGAPPRDDRPSGGVVGQDSG